MKKFAVIVKHFWQHYDDGEMICGNCRAMKNRQTTNAYCPAYGYPSEYNL